MDQATRPALGLFHSYWVTTLVMRWPTVEIPEQEARLELFHAATHDSQPISPGGRCSDHSNSFWSRVSEMICVSVEVRSLACYANSCPKRIGVTQVMTAVYNGR